MQNDCVFSSDRRYRYILTHAWEPLFPPKLCTWVGLNPSIADETHLDPTLRRIRAFSAAWGYNGFIMTNLFALVSSDPDRLYTAADPVGPENDQYMLHAIQQTRNVIVAWGVVGGHQNRCAAVLEMISGFDLIGELQKLRDAMGDSWSDTERLKALHSRLRREFFENGVAILMGSKSEFLKENRKVTNCLDVERLYIARAGASQALATRPRY